MSNNGDQNNWFK